MFYLKFILASTIDDFRRNKMRTMLTTLGIVIGVSSVILLNALTLGFKEYIRQQFESLGTNMIYILPGSMSGSVYSATSSMMEGIRFDEADWDKLNKVKNQEYVVPLVMTSVTAQNKGKEEIISIVGGTEYVFPSMNLKIDRGEFFSHSDVEKKEKVAVMGFRIAEKLFGDKYSSINKRIKLGTQNFKVIGVLQNIAGVEQVDDHNMLVFTPYTALSSLNPDNNFLAFYIKAKNEEALDPLKENLKKALLTKYKEDDFTVMDQKEMLNTVTQIFSTINLILIGLGAISLLVGGVGIMNIMYVSVSEKINEIGIRRAVGATKKDILYHFLGEAVILSISGGIIALLITSGIIIIVSPFFPAYIDVKAVIIALFVSSVIGIFFGVMPAKKASNLVPIEAIRADY